MNDESTRIETDSLGEVAVAADRLWGAQTERSRRNFAIGDHPMPAEIIRALVTVKKAGARCNRDLAGLDREVAEAIETAADEVLAGEHDDHFPLSVWQTGSGTQTNMNVNEVLANRASEVMGGGRGRDRRVHPNDHVNRSQSSNDTFPTAMHLALLAALDERLAPPLERLLASLGERAAALGDAVKIGRTHLMDATPITVGHELSSWRGQLAAAQAGLARATPSLETLAIGGTAVGTGLGAPSGWAEAMVALLSELTGFRLRPAPDPLVEQAAHDAVVEVHGALRRLAVALGKIANDVRWLASGPRAGLGELVIPANEPGSSIMPGKVNPTQCEAVLMVVARVIGNDTTVAVAGASGNFQLNVQKPLLAAVTLESIVLLGDAIDAFDRLLVRGLDVDRGRMGELVERSLMLVTALSPAIGYDRAAKIAAQAHEEGRTLREVALERGVDASTFDRLVDPSAMARGD